MQDNLIEIIEQYLKIESNYAVIINGNYGIGKTHFIKNELFPKIIKIPLPQNKNKRYTPIHISLFGIKTIEDLQIQIFLGIYPILEKKGIKLATGVVKSLIRGIAQLNGLGDTKDYFSENGISPKDWINFDQIVLFLDDLDRKSESLDITETLGFINTLVENHGVKILIIANEEVLRNDKNYTSELREKVIGISIEFIPKNEHVFELIIKERYESANKPYYDYLSENKSTIIDVLQKNNNNLRNLIYFLEHFRIIFSKLNEQFETDADFNISKTKKLDTVIYFSLTIAFEFKQGNINSLNFDKIKESNNVILLNQLSNLLKKDDKPTEKSYAVHFLEKYYGKIEFVFFQSIFTFLTGQSAFDKDELIEELKKIFIVEDGDIPESQKLLTKLGYFDCLKLTDREYKKSTYDMLEYVDKGKYSLEQYPTVFHFAIRFDNILQFNIQKLKKRFKKGIENGEYRYQYDRHFRFQISISDDTEFKEDINEIMDYCITKNKKLEQKIEENNFDSLLKLLSSDIGKFMELQYEPDNKYRSNPFWTEIPINKAYQIINKLSNYDLIDLSFYFKERYRKYIISALYPEKEFLVNIRELINKPKKRKVKNLRNAALDFLINKIDDCTKNFEN